MNIKGLFITLLFLKQGTKAKHNVVQSPADVNHSSSSGSCWWNPFVHPVRDCFLQEQEDGAHWIKLTGTNSCHLWWCLWVLSALEIHHRVWLCCQRWRCREIMAWATRAIVTASR